MNSILVTQIICPWGGGGGSLGLPFGVVLRASLGSVLDILWRSLREVLGDDPLGVVFGKFFGDPLEIFEGSAW